MISNPVMFIGQAILNAIVGAPLSADSNGLLASGIPNTEVSATSNATTTSTTDVQMASMTVTPVSGDYLVWFSATITHSSSAPTTAVSLYVGGVQKSDSVKSFGAGLGLTINPAVSCAINGKVTVNGSQAIEIRWKTTSGTATASQRTLNIMRIA